MAISYTGDDLKQWLQTDPQYGQEWKFILNKLTAMGNQFTVRSLFGRKFKGTDSEVIVSPGANTRFEATQWAADAIREWAGNGCSLTKPYFMYIARQWANDGPSRGHTAKCLGSTLDFLTMRSRAGSHNSSSDMLHGSASIFIDVSNVFCWVYTDRINAIQNKEIKLASGIAGRKPSKDGPPGLNRRFWNTNGNGNPAFNSDEDQTHHFAGYFQFGATFGDGESGMHLALSNTGDWSILDQKILNKGDYDLGFVAARWGKSYSEQPRFIGKEVESELT